MKSSIRRKFNQGIAFFFIIILLLSVLSAIYLNRLSKKTNAILKENVTSVVYARDMMRALTTINLGVSGYTVEPGINDSLAITRGLFMFDKTLKLEKNNITEIGEDKMADDIDEAFREYRNSVLDYVKAPKAVAIPILQAKFNSLYTKLGLLSNLNEQAIEVKTDDAQKSAKSAWIQMSLIGSVCFIVAFAFTLSFASYFNERISQLYNGIKEIASNNYDQRLYFNGRDEFYEISVIFNNMADKLSVTNQKKPYNFEDDLEHNSSLNNMEELKKMLIRIKSIEIQATEIISNIENKNL